MEHKRNIGRNRVFRSLLSAGVSFTEAVAQTGIRKSTAYFHLDQMRKRGEWHKPKLKAGPKSSCTVCGVRTKRRKYCDEHAGASKSAKIDVKRTLRDIWSLAGYQRSARIRQHARAVYIASDAPKCCKKCDYSTSFDVCHVKAIALHGPDSTIEQVNSLSNLVALCKRCHWEFDHGEDPLDAFLSKKNQVVSLVVG